MISGRWLTRGVAALALAGYFTAARSTGNLYPFSTFPMYAALPGTSGSRIVVLDGAGGAHEVDSFAAYSCAGAVDVDQPRCLEGGSVYAIGYADREARDYIEAHRGAPTGAEPVEIVRRVWRLTPGKDGAEESDCPLAGCRAVRR